MDVTQLVRPAGTGEYPPLARGYILGAAGKPGTNVAAFTELVDVILPEGSTERHYGPCPWGAIHGTRLPAAGAQCVVCFDEQNQPTVIWWSGAQKEPTFTPGAESITEAMLQKEAVTTSRLANAAVTNAKLAVPYTRGVANVVFTASQSATALGVAHGLGTTPMVVLLTLKAGGLGASFTFDATSYGATEFTINGWTSVSTSATLPVAWLAMA